MASLLHPLQSASQKCRPKHQVLVLRCYPKYQKNVQDIKPNSSELSYLLYYASTRRSKLIKVGAFLEKKTASDVWRLKLGNVQVTLQILTAIIEKAPRDLSLYAGSVLTILETVLKSKDINMVEESLPTFEAYCKHVETSALTADQTRSKQYLNLIQIYAGYGTPDESTKARQGQSLPLALRWRTASLRAIRAVVGSDALVADSIAQLNVVVPIILENLSLEDDQISGHLQQKAQVGEKQSLEIARRRRLSIATVSTVDETDANPVGAETTADADKVAQEEVRILAIRCLKQIFSISTASTRGQTRLATALTLKFIASKPRPRPMDERDPRTGLVGNWATSLFEAIARWTPVQDRFVIIVTAMETLTRSPIVESVLEKQLVLAQLIDWLLRSDINLIGLSVMDVLLGLIQHMLLLLQLGGRDSKISPHAQQGDVFGLFKEAQDAFDPGEILAQPNLDREPSTQITPSPVRIELLTFLQRCISDLGTHIYYTDQITDMITAILARLKPSSSQSDGSSIAAAINNPAAATKAIADSISLQEDPNTDGFFSFATARVIALNAVKDILTTANSRKTSIGTSAEVRSRVGVQVWESTQWLLKDEDPTVRFAYVEALMAWLKYETNRADTLLPKDGIRKNKTKKEVQNGEAKLAKRAVSNASKRETRVAASTFHQLLNLALYDNILDMAESETDILSMFLLMATMVERLGVNAVRVGLPMVMTLQNTALNSQSVSSTRAKVNIASLVHGYLWSVTDKFDLETTRQGHEINDEVARRKRMSIWFDKVRVRPLSMDQIKHLMGPNEKLSVYSDEYVETMKPFFSVTELVNEIAYSYNNSLLTPPSSPPASPGRVFSVPTLGFGYGYGTAPVSRPSPEDELPQKVKDEMSAQWSRENCIANIEKEAAGSVSGSRAGGSSRGQHLQVNSMGNGGISGRESPASPQDGPVAQHIVSGLGSLSRQRQFGKSGSDINLATTSSRDSTMRVSELKRALSGFQNGARNESPLRRPATSSRRSLRSQDSESMLSWNEADDTEAPSTNLNGEASGDSKASDVRPGTARSMKNRSSAHEQTTLGVSSISPSIDDDIPPVPKIPSTLNLPGTWPRDVSPSRPQTAKASSQTHLADTTTVNKNRIGSGPYASVNSKAGNKRSSRPVSRAGGASIWSEKRVVSSKTDLSDFLAGIETGGGNPTEVRKEHEKKRLTIPPY